LNTNRMNINRGRNIAPRMRPRFYPRHFTINGSPMLGRAVAIKHTPVEPQSAPSTQGMDQPDELKVGELVIVGEKDTISINVNGEKYLIAYRNRLIKFIE
jgi:co-chaperonin GroES (HSP10)